MHFRNDGQHVLGFSESMIMLPGSLPNATKVGANGQPAQIPEGASENLRDLVVSRSAKKGLGMSDDRDAAWWLAWGIDEHFDGPGRAVEKDLKRTFPDLFLKRLLQTAFNHSSSCPP